MNSPANTESTSFTRDILGRFTCNGLDEALGTVDPAAHRDNRPFDCIIVGGGSFGGVLASHLFQADKRRSRRILVLDAGPLALPEHWQNLPAPFELPGDAGPNSVWDKNVWNSDSPQDWNRRFPGLAFCLGGRSVFWGGWSPYFIDSELDLTHWPKPVVDDLTGPALDDGFGKKFSYLDWAARQIGTERTNDFLFGPLHVGLRKRLFDGLKSRPGAETTTLTGNRGVLDELDHLEAPLAVQSASPLAGNFPFNKFNAVQLLMRAARAAQVEAEDAVPSSVANRTAAVARTKRMMVCPNVRIVRLEYDGQRITSVITNQFGQEIPIVVPPQGKVFLALGTIENTRQALLALPNVHGQIGRNLMAHLRSNLTIRVSREAFRAALAKLKQQDPATFPPELDEALQANALGASALFVKGIVPIKNGLKGHFHIQITASGLGGQGLGSEAELFKKLPDIEGLDRLGHADDQWIVITLRGIGEMFGDRVGVNPPNRITLDTFGSRGYFDFGQPRALISLESGPKDAEHGRLWKAMDDAALELAKVFADGGEVQYLFPPQGATAAKALWKTTPPIDDQMRDTLSSTHHEGGTLRMGSAPANSATDQWGRLWETDNLHAVGPALLPTLGSPNPMLSGVALAFRLGDHVLNEKPVSASEPMAPIPGGPLDETDFQTLFDGTAKSFGNWIPVGENRFALQDGCIVTQDGGDLGLLFHASARASEKFTLRLEFKTLRPTGVGNDNSGVFVRFLDPRQPVTDRSGKDVGQYGNGSYVAVDTGFEIQIDEEARGDSRKGEPDGMDKKLTGAIYDIPTESSAPYFQNYQRGSALQAGVWNVMEIRGNGQNYEVLVNGQRATIYKNLDPYRGKAGGVDPTAGCIGVQSHTGRVAFRNIRIRPTVPVAQPLSAPTRRASGTTAPAGKQF